MKMPGMLMICCLLSFPSVDSQARSQSPEKAIRPATVYAPSGLVLRSNPGQYGKALDVIDYGEQVRISGDSDEVLKHERVNWVDGHWVKVEYEGLEGYVFDGYLSPLAFPTQEFEICSHDFDLMSTLESWARYRLEPAMKEDTITRETGKMKTIQVFQNNQRLVIEDNMDHMKLDLYLSDIRIMDAYHLLMSMLPGKDQIKIFQSESLFIEDRSGEVQQIKIKLINPIEITKMKNGQVRVSTHKADYGCSF